MAAFFTGEAEISWPRPRGRSGCVITAAISISGCARRRMNVGTAKCGVPQKRMRMVSPARALPLALFPKLLDFAFYEVALQHAQMLDEENAVEVVDFMAESAGQQVLAA